MNKTKKYTLALLGFFTTFLSACSQYGDPYKDVPKEINGHPVYEVPFEQPLIIDPKKEQVFYFKLKKTKAHSKRTMQSILWQCFHLKIKNITILKREWI